MSQFERSSGVLLHLSSLPNEYGIGTLGKESYEFVDLLASMNQKIWQLCPVGPTGYGDSPYQCFSAFAGNPYFVSLEKLVEYNLLSEGDLPEKQPSACFIDFGRLYNERFPLLYKAYENFRAGTSNLNANKVEFFQLQNREWLDDYALFMALKKEHGGKSWHEWEKDLRMRKSQTLDFFRDKLAYEIDFHGFIQFLFFEQWEKVKNYANSKGVKIVGDMPIYVASDSSDAWANTEMFMFDEDRKPVKVAGVPPDYFSVTGQLWGNPLYNWDKLKETNFKWWIDRCKAGLKLFDFLRVDHFRGFTGFWAVPFEEKTAIKGEWLPACGYELFTEIKNQLGVLPILAEDLGVITSDVEKLRDDFNFPGMRILQFAFDSAEPALNFLPHSYSFNSIVYTGTHDNQTLLGWYRGAKETVQAFARDYLNAKEETILKDFIRAATASTAVFSIIPMQDLLGCGDEARMNVPSVASGNWQWRFDFDNLSEEMFDFFKHITELYSRV